MFLLYIFYCLVHSVIFFFAVFDKGENYNEIIQRLAIFEVCVTLLESLKNMVDVVFEFLNVRFHEKELFYVGFFQFFFCRGFASNLFFID